MKTNEWLALFLEENRADFVQSLRDGAGRLNLEPGESGVEQLVDAFGSDFDAEACSAAPAALDGIAQGDRDAALSLWSIAEQRLMACIAAEAEMTGGARRLAYLRISDYAAQLQTAL